MIYYEREVKKSLKKGILPLRAFKQFHNAFLALNLTRDFNLFDIKKIKGNFKRDYYRMRKGKYRAIFYVEDEDYYVLYSGKREEVYDKWQ